jgi:hypothetical protein
MTEEHSVAGAIVQRVDLAGRAAAVHLRVPGESFVLVIANGRGLGAGVPSGIGLVDREARASWPSARLPLPAVVDQSRARTLLVGGRLEAVTAERLVVLREGKRWALVLEGAGEHGRVRLRPAPDEAEAPTEPATDRSRAELEERGRRLGPWLATSAVVARRVAIARAIDQGIARLRKRAQAVEGDLARIGDADALAAQASWLVAEASRAPRGAIKLEVTDWSSGEPQPLVVPLDPARPARAQVEAMFARARRLKKGAAIAEARLAETRAQLTGLAAIKGELEARTGEAQGFTLAEMEALAARAKTVAPRDVQIIVVDSDGGGEQARARSGARDARAVPAVPYRAFVREDGVRILVGKGAEKNDRLTFQLARPHDLWLHAKGRTGAHVIVPSGRGAGVTGELLADAALLAAHFSDARDEAVVDVEYTARKYLKKPRGGAPGTVVIEREKVIALRMDPQRRKVLLEREEI